MLQKLRLTLLLLIGGKTDKKYWKRNNDRQNINIVRMIFLYFEKCIQSNVFATTERHFQMFKCSKTLVYIHYIYTQLAFKYTEYTSVQKRSMLTSEAIPTLQAPHIPRLMRTERIFTVPANGCT